MEKIDKKFIIVFSITLLFLMISFITHQVFNQYIYIAIWAIIYIILLLWNGKFTDKSIYKKDTLQQIFIYTFIYFIVYYLCGIWIGYLQSTIHLTFLNIIKNCLPIILQIIILELIRFQVMGRPRINKWVTVLLIIVYTVYATLLCLNRYQLSNPEDIVRIICMVIIPNLAKQSFLCYLSHLGGELPTILYCLLTELYYYILPIFPDFGEYMQAVLDFMLPMMEFLRFNHLYTKKKVIPSRHKYRNRILFGVMIILLSSVVVYLISDKFQYRAVTVGSGSMVPTLNVGDIVVVSTVSECDQIQVGDILLFKHGTTQMIHRIMNIQMNGNDCSITTKGDYNTDEDGWITTKDDIIGIAKYHIPYLGYPAVWLSKKLR